MDDHAFKMAVDGMVYNMVSTPTNETATVLKFGGSSFYSFIDISRRAGNKRAAP
jgi:hypothetical protein